MGHSMKDPIPHGFHWERSLFWVEATTAVLHASQSVLLGSGSSPFHQTSWVDAGLLPVGNFVLTVLLGCQ